MNDKVCIHCGESFKKYGNTKYCSRKCMAEGFKIYKTCPVCNTSFGGVKGRKTCSKKCDNVTRNKYKINLREFDDSYMPEPNTGCWIWIGRSYAKGYGVFYKNKVDHFAHRFSYMLFKGTIKKGISVCHHCDNRLCVNPDHLFLGTTQDNMNDMMNKGRSARGIKNKNAKMDEVGVSVSREAVSIGFTCRQVSKYFNVTRQTIHQIIHRKIWKHV